MSPERVNPSGPPPSCADVLARVYEFLDQELPSDIDTRVREHLAVCEQCNGAVEHERAFLRCVRRTGGDAAPAELRARIQSLLSGRESSRERR